MGSVSLLSISVAAQVPKFVLPRTAALQKPGKQIECEIFEKGKEASRSCMAAWQHSAALPGAPHLVITMPCRSMRGSNFPLLPGLEVQCGLHAVVTRRSHRRIFAQCIQLLTLSSQGVYDIRAPYRSPYYKGMLLFKGLYCGSLIFVNAHQSNLVLSRNPWRWSLPVAAKAHQVRV